MRWIDLQKPASCFLVCVVFTSICGLLVGCSGSASSSSMMPTPTPAPSPNPSPSPVPSPTPSPSPGSASASYLYVGIAANNGGLQGFHVDPQTGALAEVPGSPVLFGTAMNTIPQAGPIATANGHVFVGFGPANSAAPVIRSYSVDATTGSLGSVTETNAGAVSGDEQIRSLMTDPAGHNLYAVFQNNIASFQINQDGSLNFLGTLPNLATAFIFSLTIDPAANMAFLGVDNCPPKGPCAGPPDILLLDRDPNTGMLSNTQKLMGQNNVESPGALAIDPSGTHLVAWTVATNGNAQISVFNVTSSGTVSPAAGSPYTPQAGLPPMVFRFDPTGHFLYVLNSSFASPQPESVTVYAISQTGTLQQLQSQSLPPGNFASTIVVGSRFLFVVDSQAGTMPSVIYVLERDANSGTVSSPVFSLPDRPGGTQAGLGDAVELNF